MTDDTNAMEGMAAGLASEGLDGRPPGAAVDAAETGAGQPRAPTGPRDQARKAGRHTPLLHAIVRNRVFWEAKERLGLAGGGETRSVLSDERTLARFKLALYGDGAAGSVARARSAARRPMPAPSRWLARQPAPMAGKLAFLEAVARSLGDDWSRDARSFLDVTIAMGRLQLMLRQIVHANAAHGERPERGSALITVPPAEDHHFAQCLIDELFRAEGWVTDLFWPADRTAIVDRIVDRGHDIVCLSWSTGALAGIARDTVTAIESIPYGKRPAIVAGGRASHEHGGWLVRLGVDCICESTYGALAAARQLLETRASSTGGPPPSPLSPSPAATP